MDNILDFSACIVAGGDNLRPCIEQARTFYSEMSEEYFNHILAKEDKALSESACGFLLLDNLLTKNAIDKSGLVISRNADSRPCIINRRDIDFSISHSEGAAICCLLTGKDAKIGCDIQRARSYSTEKIASLAKIFMSENDYSEFLKNTDEKHFYTVWTRREAYIKAEGGDVFADLRGMDFNGDRYRTGVINACGNRYYYSVYTTINTRRTNESIST